MYTKTFIKAHFISRETPHGTPAAAQALTPAMSEEVESLSCEVLGEFLLSKGIDSSVATKIVDNWIDGELFVGLEEMDFSEMTPVLGDRMRLQRILNIVRNLVRNLVGFMIILNYKLLTGSGTRQQYSGFE